MATIDGARAMRLDTEIGSIETGKRADVIVVDLAKPHSSPQADVVSTLVYSAQASDVRATIIDGRVVMRDGALAMREQFLAESNRSIALRGEKVKS